MLKHTDFYIKDDGGSTATSTGGTNISDGQWHHIVVTVDKSANQTIYVDGSAQDPESVTSVGNINTDDVDVIAIGRYHHTNAWKRYFSGSIDDVRIYNKVLTTTEIAKNRRHGTAKHKD